MKNFIFFFLVISFTNTYGQQKSTSLVNKIIYTWSKVSDFNTQSINVLDTSDDIEDSLTKYNTTLSLLISSSEFSFLNSSDLQKIIDSTDIKVIISKDAKLKAISWMINNDLPEPTCCNVFILGTRKPQIISIGGTTGQDFGINVQLNKIIDVSLKNKTFYLLIGSNKCGNLCIEKLASLYVVSDSLIVKCPKAFLSGTKYLDEVKFEYSLNGEKEPSFHVINTKLISPIFDRNKEKIVGNKVYEITGNVSN